MAKYQPLWQQAGSYSASLDRSLMGTLWPIGGTIGAAPSAVASTMNMQATPGTVAVPLTSGQGTALCRWDATADSLVTLSAAPASGQSRIDVYVVQVRDNALDAGGNNDFIFAAVPGTPATTGSQVAPAVPANALALANVLVPGAVANLNTATVTDRRGGMAPRASVWRNAAWSSVALATNPFPFDTADDNPGGYYDLTGSGKFTCPIAGRYLINAKLSATPTAAGQFGRVGFSVNGTNMKWGQYVIVGGTGAQCDPGVTFPYRANAGDQIIIMYMFSATLVGVTGAGIVWATFDYIGP